MDLGELAQSALALIFVLSLIGLGAAVLKRAGWGVGTAARSRAGRRLSLVEVMPLDPRRKLVLVRRDGTEHLLLLGAQSELVVETNISSPPEDFAAEVEKSLDREVSP